jgi:hypothetical protein
VEGLGVTGIRNPYPKPLTWVEVRFSDGLGLVMLALRRVRGNAGWKMSEERGGLGWEGFAGGLSTGSALILPRASFPINTLCRHF